MQTEKMQLQVVTTNMLSKQEREQHVANLLVAVDEGEIDPLKAHLQLKNVEDILKRLTDKQKYPATANKWGEAVLEAAQKHGAKSFELMNSKIEIKEAGTTYDYSVCDDAIINDLHSQLEALKKKVKERETFLQTVPEAGLVVTDEGSGETTKIFRPAKKSSTTVMVTLK